MAEKHYLRKAERWDLPALEILLKKGIEESNGLLPPYDPSHTWHATLNQVDMGLVVLSCVAQDDNPKTERITGGIALDLQGFSWNPDFKLLRSVHYYIVKEHRTAKIGDDYVAGALLTAAKGVAFQISCERSENLKQSTGETRWWPMPLIIETFHTVGPEAAIEKKDAWMKLNHFTHCGSNHLWIPAAPEEFAKAA